LHDSADNSAPAAIVSVGVCIRLATIGLLVVIAIGETGSADPTTDPCITTPVGHVIVRAHDAAAAAIADVSVDGSFAAVGLLIVIAIGETGSAEPVTDPCSTTPVRHVIVRAHDAAAAAIAEVSVDGGFAAVGLLIVIAIGETGSAEPATDPSIATPARHVIVRARDAAAATIGEGIQPGFAAIGVLTIAIPKTAIAGTDCATTHLAGSRGIGSRADVTATAAVVRVIIQCGFAAIGPLIEIAVAKAGSASAATGAARAADGCHVIA